MATSSETPQPPFYGMVRTQGISDSIFSMTLILLVFGLDVPSPGPKMPSLGAALAEYSPELIGYAVGSLFVGMMWIAHHHLLNAYKCVNTIFMAINFVFLTVALYVGAVIISLISPMLTMLAHIVSAIAVIGLLIWNAQRRVAQPVLSTQLSD